MRLSILAFAFGVLALQRQPVLPPWAPDLCWAALLLPFLVWWRWPGRRYAAMVLCFALGFGWAAWQAERGLADQLAGELEGRDLELIGIVAELPQSFSQGSRFEFAVEQSLNAPHGVPKRILLSWYQGRGDGEYGEVLPLRPGERWRLTVRLKRPHGNANPGGFDYEAWLLERQIRATGYVRPNRPERQDELVWQPAFLVERVRHHVRQSFTRILPAERYPWAGVLTALAIGDQRAIQVVSVKYKLS